MRTPWPPGSCHQCWTSPSTNWRDAAWRMWAAREVRRGQQEREHVLQLIPEPERAARLIERRASPDAAGQRLVEEPVVEHQIHRAVGCGDLHRAEQRSPEAPHIVECRGDPLRRRGCAARVTTRSLRRRPRRAARSATCSCPGSSVTRTCTAPHGSIVAPVRFDSSSRSSAAGAPSVPLRPMNSVRSPVSVRWSPPKRSRNATRSANASRNALDASSAPVVGSRRVTTCSPVR